MARPEPWGDWRVNARLIGPIADLLCHSDVKTVYKNENELLIFICSSDSYDEGNFLLPNIKNWKRLWENRLHGSSWFSRCLLLYVGACAQRRSILQSWTALRKSSWRAHWSMIEYRLKTFRISRLRKLPYRPRVWVQPSPVAAIFSGTGLGNRAFGCLRSSGIVWDNA